MTTVTRPPSGRYGPEPDPRTRHRRVVLLWMLGVVGLGVTVWMGLGMAATPVTWQDVGFRIENDAVEVTYDVVRVDPAVAVQCRLQALSVRHAQVGVVTVDVPPSSQTVERLTATIRTAEPAVTGVVDSCWVADED